MAEAPKRIATTKSMRAETICEGGGAGGGVASVVWRVWRVAGGLRPSFSWPIVLAMLCPCTCNVGAKAIVLAMPTCVLVMPAQRLNKSKRTELRGPRHRRTNQPILAT